MSPQPLFEALWPLALLFPLLITAGLLVKGLRPTALTLVPLGALPALGLALVIAVVALVALLRADRDAGRTDPLACPGCRW